MTREMTFHAPVHIGCKEGEACWIEMQRKALREIAKARIASGVARTYSTNDYARACKKCGITMRWTRDADGNDSPLEPNTPKEAAA
jgi:hypothetical protein